MKTLASYIINESKTGIGFAGGVIGPLSKKEAEDVFAAGKSAGFDPDIFDLGGGEFAIELFMNYVRDFESPEFIVWKKFITKWAGGKIVNPSFSDATPEQVKKIKELFPVSSQNIESYEPGIGQIFGEFSWNDFEEWFRELAALDK